MGDEQRKSSISPWVPISFGTTGLLIGFVAGQSTTPIVGTLLPLLFGIIGGGAGFFAVQKSERSLIVGISLTALTSMCLFGVVEGARLRLQTPWHCVLSICSESPVISAKLDLPPEQIDQEKLLLLLSVKVHLQQGAFDTKDSERVFRIAKDASVAELKKLDQRLAHITITQTEPTTHPELGSERTPRSDTMVPSVGGGSTGNQPNQALIGLPGPNRSSQPDYPSKPMWLPAPPQGRPKPDRSSKPERPRPPGPQQK